MAHDLSGHKVVLDYLVLMQCAAAALRYTKAELEKQEYAMRDALDTLQLAVARGEHIETRDIVRADSASEYYRQAATLYEHCVKTYTHLLAMHTRGEVELKNRPPVRCE